MLAKLAIHISKNEKDKKMWFLTLREGHVTLSNCFFLLSSISMFSSIYNISSEKKCIYIHSYCIWQTKYKNNTMQSYFCR